MSASSFSLSHGFWTKFSAPARIASTTLPTVPKAVIIITGSPGCTSRIRGRSSIPVCPGRARSSNSRSYSLRASRSRPAAPSPAASTANPSRFSSVSSDSRIACSSSMMRILGSPTIRAIRCRLVDSTESSVTSGMDRLSLIRRYAALLSLLVGCGARTGRQKLQLKGRAHSGFALHMNLACMLLHDPVAHRKPKACALVLAVLRLAFRRKEWIVDAVQVFLFDAAARVLNPHKHTPRAIEGSNLQRGVCGSKHRILRVQHKVQNHLLQLALVAVNACELRIEVHFHANLRRLELMLQQRHRIAQQIVQVHARELRAAGTREVQQAIHNLRRTEGLLRNLFKHRSEPFVVAHVLGQHLRIAGDDRQRRIHFVRYAGSQQAN